MAEEADPQTLERPTPSVPDVGSFGTTFAAKPPAAVEPALPTAPASGGFLADAGYDPAKTQAVSQELGGVLREKAQGWADQDAERKLGQDRERMDRAYRMEQSSVDDPALRPWNADKERNERMRGPMEQFGSIGSVFAMAASMFTKTPMTSALNAGAAAMRSIQEHDEKGYESAYQAWKDNSTLALKRFEMERNLFDDANKLASTDMQLWSARRLAIAAKFEDRKAIVMLENGMSQELLDLDAKKVGMAKSLQEQMKGFEEYDRDRRIFKDGMDAFKAENPNATPSQDVQHRLQLLHDIKSGARSWQQEAMRNFELTEPNATPERRAEFMRSLRGGAAARPLSPEQEFTKRFYEDKPEATSEEFSKAFGEFKKGQKKDATRNADQEFIKTYWEDHPEATSEDFAKAFGEFKKGQKQPVASGGATNLTTERQRAQDVAAYREKLKGEKNEDGSPKYGAEEIARKAAEYEKSLKIDATAPTANRRDQLASHITRFKVAEQTIDKVEALLKKHNALTGLGGRITRPGEVVGNWFGSNETDRAQFKTYIQELRELGPRLINESHSRPLSAEEQKIADIVPGLNAGDTTTNTAKRLVELQKLFRTLRGDLTKRYEGTWTPEGATGSPPDKPGSPAEGGNWWQKLPDKRSSLDEGRVISDETPFGVKPGQQYAMANKLPIPGMGGITAEIDQQAGGGFARGASVPGPSRRQGPMSDAEYRSKHMQLQELKATVARLGPMREKLVELGATPEQMSKMDAAQAFKFIKERSPGGMGKVSSGWHERNQEFIDQIRAMQDELTGAWQGGK